MQKPDACGKATGSTVRPETDPVNAPAEHATSAAAEAADLRPLGPAPGLPASTRAPGTGTPPSPADQDVLPEGPELPPESGHQDVESWIDGLEPGWDAVQLGRYLDRLAALLRGAGETYTGAALDVLIGRVDKALRKQDYKVLSKKELRKLLLQEPKPRETAPGERPDAWGPRSQYEALSAAKLGPGVAGVPRCGYVDLDAGDPAPVTNFEVVIEENLTVQDDVEPATVFRGRLRLEDREAPLRLTAAEYADGNRLLAALYAAGGTDLMIKCPPGALRNAVAELNPERRLRTVTTNLGWNQDQTAYLVPSGVITAAGFAPAGPDTPLTVDLSDQAVARQLDLRPPPPDEVQALKRHLVEDWLNSHDRRVTYSLLGTVAAAVLAPFSGGIPRYALWLTGLSGEGKSFQGRLAQHFFGDFGGLGPGARIQTWASTPNNIQAVGYYFRDAVYLVDDFKPNAMKDAQRLQILALLQAYHDSTARGRLRANATVMESRPIRGLLLSTGEDVPEQSASTSARLIVIAVPREGKSRDHGLRCVARCRQYSAVTADLIQWLLARGVTREFPDRCRELQDQFLKGIEGAQNDLRIAGNVALLGAGFRAAAEYLGDVWPAWEAEAERFLGEDLVAVRDGMLREVAEQQEGTVFLNTLSELICWGRVRIEGHSGQEVSDIDAPVVGKLEWHGATERVLLSMMLALKEVQRCLRDQGKPELRSSTQALVGQLREGGWILATESSNERLDGRQTRCQALKPEAVLGDHRPRTMPRRLPFSVVGQNETQS